MGRRKKVDLNKLNPLESVTIGEIKKPKFVLLKTFILIGLFIAVVFYMDEIKVYLDKYVGVYFGITSESNTVSNPVINNTTEDPNNTTEDPKLDYEVYTFGETTDLDFLDNYNIKLTKISLSEQNVLTFEITTDDTSYTLDTQNVYFIIYNSEDIAVNYFHLTGTVTKDNYIGKAFDTNGGTKFSVRALETKDYPVYDILADDDGNSNFICTKGTEKYTYYFKDSKLTKVEFISSFANDLPNYNELKENYSKLKLNYDGEEGVVTKFDTSVANNNTTFTFSIDYSKSEKEIEGGLFYRKNTSYNIVMFKNEADLYDCIPDDLTGN